jgi:hypothetical protein
MRTLMKVFLLFTSFVYLLDIPLKQLNEYRFK